MTLTFLKATQTLPNSVSLVLILRHIKFGTNRSNSSEDNGTQSYFENFNTVTLTIKIAIQAFCMRNTLFSEFCMTLPSNSKKDYPSLLPPPAQPPCFPPPSLSLPLHFITGWYPYHDKINDEPSANIAKQCYCWLHPFSQQLLSKLQQRHNRTETTQKCTVQIHNSAMFSNMQRLKTISHSAQQMESTVLKRGKRIQNDILMAYSIQERKF